MEINKAFILIVDDITENLRLLSTMLDKQGYEVLTVTNGEMALKTVFNKVPDLILLDIMMPEMDGYQVCQALKSNEVTNDIPVIFLSALNDIFDKVKAFEYGAVDYITKPFEEEEVFMRIRNQLILKKQKILLQKEIEKRQKIERLLIHANKNLEKIANLDALTGIANRRFFNEILSQEWQRCNRENTFLALILCDLDYFKNYNDYYGHQKGDECLKSFAQIINSCVKRAADLVARYGGEEFAVILPNTNLEGAKEVGELIRNHLNTARLLHEKSAISDYLTVSLGVVSMIPDSDFTPENLIKFADEALYQAKNNGRNCMAVFNNL
jgi:diguanylate cyclase (GGDEF)-like protein